MAIPTGIASTRTLTDIANAIRYQNGETRDYKPCEMAEAIRALEWKTPRAYALLTYPEEGTNEQKLLFVRAEQAPEPMTMYNKQPIQEVYAGFEDALYTAASQVPWYSKHDDITSVEFCDAVKPKSCAYWFYMFRNCTSFNLGNLDLSEAESLAYSFYYCSSVASISLVRKGSALLSNMKYCFYYCTSLEVLDVGYLEVSGVVNANYMFQRMSAVTEIDMSGLFWGSATTNINSMFNGDAKLTAIYAKAGTALTGAAASTNVFYNCYNLKGGAGTALDGTTSVSSSYIGGAYARIDGLGGLPGYFTAK